MLAETDPAATIGAFGDFLAFKEHVHGAERAALASKVHKKSKKPRVVPTDEIAKAEEQADKIKEDGTKEAQAAIDREQQRIGASRSSRTCTPWLQPMALWRPSAVIN